MTKIQNISNLEFPVLIFEFLILLKIYFGFRISDFVLPNRKFSNNTQ